MVMLLSLRAFRLMPSALLFDVVEISPYLCNHRVFVPNFGYVTINPFPNKPLVLRVCGRSLLKTLWEKEKLLVNEQFLLFPQCFLSF